MNAIEEVLITLLILQGLGIIAHVFLAIRARRSFKRLSRLKADVLKSRWAVAVSRESAESLPAIDRLEPKLEIVGLRPLNLLAPAIDPDIQRIPADWPLL